MPNCLFSHLSFRRPCDTSLHQPGTEFARNSDSRNLIRLSIIREQDVVQMLLSYLTERHKMERTAEETAEIERHKYFLSEKAGHDVGWEFAEHDWDEHHAHDYRVMMGTVPKSKVGGLMKKWFGGGQSNPS